MSLWLDEEFLGRLSAFLPRFHKQSAHTYTFRCPFCGDSQKSQSKTRGYLFRYRDGYFFKCHNCNETASFRKFLERLDPAIYREYLLRSIQDSHPSANAESLAVYLPAPAPAPPTAPKAVDLPSIADLPADHLAAEYLATRQIPKRAWPFFYFTETWTEWIKTLGWDYDYKEDGLPRLVIPWFTERGGPVIGAQFRALIPGKQRYVTLKSTPEADKVYGLDRINGMRKIYLVEGPFDSWFLPNAVAAMGSDIRRVADKFFRDDEPVFVWDNEPRNPVIVNSLYQAIQDNHDVVVWPTTLPEKDLNDMHLVGIDVNALVKERTFSGLKAQLEFMKWKRC